MKRKGIKRLVLGIVAVISVVMLAVLPMIAKRNGTAYGPRMTILRGVADSGDIVTGIHGGGVLMVQTPEKITVPTSVKLTKFLVENGETVCAGDPIAQVDSVTIMAAIADTQHNLDQLTQQIQTIPKDSGTVKLKAPTGGIIKAIYARKGQSVQDVILGHGSLAVLSLGGRMTVKVDTELVIPAGSAVSVRFENGTAVDAYYYVAVATKADCRHQGMMRKLLTKSLKQKLLTLRASGTDIPFQAHNLAIPGSTPAAREIC